MQKISVNALERVRPALTCCKPDKISKALGFFDQSLAAVATTRPEHYFDLDVRFAEFHPPDNQDEFRHYMDQLPADIHVGSRAQLRTYHECRQTGGIAMWTTLSTSRVLPSPTEYQVYRNSL